MKRTIEEQKAMTPDQVAELTDRLIRELRNFPDLKYLPSKSGSYFYTMDGKFTISVNSEWHGEFCDDNIVYDYIQVLTNIDNTEAKQVFTCDTAAALRFWLDKGQPKVADIIEAHNGGCIDGYKWFSDHFVALDDLMELGFDTQVLRDQLNKAFTEFEAVAVKR